MKGQENTPKPMQGNSGITHHEILLFTCTCENAVPEVFFQLPWERLPVPARESPRPLFSCRGINLIIPLAIQPFRVIEREKCVYN